MAQQSPSSVSERIDVFLRSANIPDLTRGRHNVNAILQRNGEPAFEYLVDGQQLIAESADPDMALNNLERLLDNSVSYPILQELLQTYPEAAKTLIALLAGSQFLSDTLALQPSAMKILALPLRYTPTKNE